MESLKIGIVICSRSESSRIKRKPFQKINGLPIINHLVNRCALSGFPVIMAIPQVELPEYSKELKNAKCDFYLDQINYANPLGRMHNAAQFFGLDAVIRITHDKIFIDPDLLKDAVNVFIKTKVDYLHCKEITEGLGFEIISFSALGKAAQSYKNVEHISYAIKAVTNRIHVYKPEARYYKPYRFLIDYPSDLVFQELIFERLGNDCTFFKACDYIINNSWVNDINRQPLYTVYTCAYNAEKYLKTCLSSIKRQCTNDKTEIILIDDCSSDKTYEQLLRFSLENNNSTVIRNPVNIGLSSSSNIALARARGKYITRLDADDFFHKDFAIKKMASFMETNNHDVVYPDNFFGNLNTVQKGFDCHHAGGATFRSMALKQMKFMDGLRGYEGLDLFERAKEMLNIGYLQEPLFFYRQHSDSMSKTNLEEREKIKEKIYGA